MASGAVNVNGTLYYGIATRSNVNSKVKGTFSTSDGYCPTYEEIKKNCTILSTSGSSKKCVKTSDLKFEGTISMKVTVFNNKNTDASLSGNGDYNYARIQISTDKENWETLSEVETENIAKHGTKTFNIPAVGLTKYNLSTTQYYFRVTCGRTGGDRTWKYGINSNSSYTNCPRVTARTGETPVYPVQQTSTSGYSLIGQKPVTHVYFEITN